MNLAVSASGTFPAVYIFLPGSGSASDRSSSARECSSCMPSCSDWVVPSSTALCVFVSHFLFRRSGKSCAIVASTSVTKYSSCNLLTIQLADFDALVDCVHEQMYHSMKLFQQTLRGFKFVPMLHNIFVVADKAPRPKSTQLFSFPSQNGLVMDG